ncbi:E3 ubiquitin-protein ligase HERC2-like, partial [Trifolium medium]|nr:E3 ubiquitin-protein ligase HERC2-like [Trifolium medium]
MIKILVEFGCNVQVYLVLLKAEIVRQRNDSVDSSPIDRPFGGALELNSSISTGRFSFESAFREPTSNRRRSDVGSDNASMPVRTSVGDGSRVSVSSVGYASSVGSGPDDIESLGDVFIWGE